MCVYCQAGQEHPPCFQGALQRWRFPSRCVCPSDQSVSLATFDLWEPLALRDLHGLVLVSLLTPGTGHNRPQAPNPTSPAGQTHAVFPSCTTQLHVEFVMHISFCRTLLRRASVTVSYNAESECPAVNPQKPKQ